MKKLLALLLLCSACHKTTTSPSTQSQPPTNQSTLHTFVYKFIGTGNPVIRTYFAPNQQNVPTILKNDTSYSNISSITYQFAQGNPYQYNYRLTATMPIWSDSIRLEIWRDGILQATHREEGYDELNYYY